MTSQNTTVTTASKSSVGRTNYARLGQAAQVQLPYILKELLKFYIRPSNILQECQKDVILFYKVLTLNERDKVKLASTKGYDDFDIPLIYKLFRNIVHKICWNAPNPTNGWASSTEPAPNEVTLGDDIERFRLKRNEIIHRGNVNVTDQEFSSYFTEFKDVAGRIENVLNNQNHAFAFVAEFDALETLCMDEAAEKKYIEDFQKWAEKERALLLQLEAKIITPPEDIIAVEGEDIQFESTVHMPDSNIQPQWGRVDSSGSPENITLEKHHQKLTLTIRGASKENEGKYALQVGNEKHESELIVKEREPHLKLRNYQLELAEVALQSENTMVCAGTNSGKTYVAFFVIESHLLKNPNGKVVFINRTNVLLQQQYARACETFPKLHSQGKIVKWEAGIDLDGEFANVVNSSSLLFLTPKSLSNHLDEHASTKVSIANFTLIVLDECHHTFGQSLYNEVMSYYRHQKYSSKSGQLPQILGLTASPGTNKAKNIQSAVDHLKKVMTNLDVHKLSFVKKYEDELLQYTSTPTKVLIKSTKRLSDPVCQILLTAIQYVENMLSSSLVTNFLANHIEDTKDLTTALTSPPSSKMEMSYIQWMAETKEKIEHVLHKDVFVPRFLHTCFRHLEVYTECLEVNCLLEINDVRDVITEEYARLSYESQSANTEEEKEIVARLKNVFQDILRLDRRIEGNPDIKEIKNKLKGEYDKLGEESRFMIFVKTRATAKALAERLPEYLRSTHLTGSHVSKAEGGLSNDEQLQVVDKFRNGLHLCIVATSVACEGLDIQQCNLVIRYKFNADEISSLQMRGRIRQKGGTEILLVSEKEIHQEAVNIERQYLMKEAIKIVSPLNMSRDIAIAERNVYEQEELERITTKMKELKQIRGEFFVKCKYCGIDITNGHLIRHIKKKMYVVCDKNIIKRIKRVPVDKKKIKTFDGCTKRDKAFGLECGHNWGSFIIFDNCEFVALSQDYIKIFDVKANSFLTCKKWSEITFTIDELSAEDIFRYNED